MEARTTAGGGASLLAGAARRWWLPVLGLVAGVLVGLGLLALLPTSYASTASVLVTPVGQVAGSTGTRTSTDVNLDTEAQVVGSSEVATAAGRLLGGSQDVSTLQDDVSVSVPPNSSILSITFTTGSADAAQRGAHAFAQAYLDNRAATAKRQVDASVAGLQTQLDADQKQLLALTGAAAGLPPTSPDRAYADAQISIVAGQVNDLAAQLAATRTAASTPGSIITDAGRPGSPSSPSPPLVVGACGLLGLLLGAGAAVLAGRRDRGLRGAADVRRLTGLPLLATVRGLAGGDGADPDAAAYDRLRNALTGSAATPLVAQVCGPGSGAVALDLGRSLSRRAGSAVLLCAHEGSVLPGLTGSEGRPGLAEVLAGEAGLDAVRVPVPGAPGVELVPPGADPARLEDLLQSPRLAELLAGVRDAGPVVLETGDPGRSAGAQSVSGTSDAVVLVAGRGGDGGRVAAASAAVRRMGGRVAGVVLLTGSGRPPTQVDVHPAPQELDFTEPATRA